MTAAQQNRPTGYGIFPESRLVAALAGTAWQVLAVFGVASALLGVIVLSWPHATLLVVGVLFGIYLLVSGVLTIMGAVGEHVPGHLRAIGFIAGSLSVLLGLICFRRPAESVLLLALWIGFGWLLRGIGQLVVTSSTPPFAGRGALIASGVLTVIAGVVAVSLPLHSIAALTLLGGIWLIVIGVGQLVEAVRLRAALRRLARDTPALDGV